jgi:hypothetical protein
VVSMNYRAHERETRHLITDSGCAIVFADERSTTRTTPRRTSRPCDRSPTAPPRCRGRSSSVLWPHSRCTSPLRRTINRKRYGNYSCMGGKGTFCVSRKQGWLDTYVADVVIERLSQPDALDVFAADDTDDAQAAQRELAALRAELTELRQVKKAGRISLSSFLEFEPDLLARIDDAQQRSAAAAGVPPLLVDTAGPDVRERWAALTMPQRREVVRALCTIYVHRTRQGTRSFDPDTVTIRWRTAEHPDSSGPSGS